MFLIFSCGDDDDDDDNDDGVSASCEALCGKFDECGIIFGDETGQVDCLDHAYCDGIKLDADFAACNNACLDIEDCDEFDDCVTNC